MQRPGAPASEPCAPANPSRCIHHVSAATARQWLCQRPLYKRHWASAFLPPTVTAAGARSAEMC
eukprot:scaffold105847_cov35-Tisochrysis_lutea.AAC.2